MNQILKYPLKLEPGTVQTISMPSMSTILCCQIQRGVPILWAAVHPKHLIHEQREFAILGTGFCYEEQVFDKYIATVQHESFVWHVFELT